MKIGIVSDTHGGDINKQEITLAIADVEDGKITVEKVVIPHDKCPCGRKSCKIHGDCEKCREAHKDGKRVLPCERKLREK